MHVDAKAIKKEFKLLLDAHRKDGDDFVTLSGKEEDTKSRESAEKATSFTAEKLVKDNADLQLFFSESTSELANKLKEESGKVETIDEAIEVESTDLNLLRNILVSAEALAVQKQEQEAEKERLKNLKQEKISKLEARQSDTRTAWKKEDIKFKEDEEAYQDNLEKERNKKEEERKYTVESRKRSENARFEYEKEVVTNQISRETAAFEADWEKRKAVLRDAEEEIKELRKKEEEFPQKLEAAEKKAKQKAISKINEEHKFEQELLQKEAEAQKDIDEGIIDSLKKDISNLEDSLKEIREDTKEVENNIIELSSKSNKQKTA